jgi:LppX_LprAFG lipoprotein
MKRTLAIALAAGVLAACGGGSSPPSVDAAKVLRDGAAAMASLHTVSATLKLTKGTVSIQGFALVSARTAVQLPSDSDTTYTVRDKDVSFSLEAVIASGHVYVHLPLSTFRELTGTEAAAFPDMAKLFDPKTGLPAVIPAGSTPKYISTDQIAGKSAYQISTSYTPEQVRGLLAQLSSNGPVAAKVWVGVSDHQIRKAVLDGAFGDGGAEAVVEVDITGFDAAVTINSPTP